jgi:hypothetical protein
MFGRDDIAVLGDAGPAGADEALLRATVFRIEISLELERVPVIGPIGIQVSKLVPAGRSQECFTIGGLRSFIVISFC